MEDQDAFERDFFQLKPYYTDVGARLQQSPQEYPILGLNLLRLLVQNRIAEFHTELELLTATALEHPCIKHAVELEQSFMEGAYNRVLTARQTVPHETYVYFMDLLARTVSEKAYDSLTVKDAKQMLLLNSDQELSEYIQEEHPEWEVKNGLVFFQKAKDSAPCKEIPLFESLKDYVSKALISTIDHLGSVTSKVDTFLDENIDEAFETNLRVLCIRQRLQTCQTYSDHEGFSQQSLLIQIPKYHKQYLLPDGRFSEAIQAEKAKAESSGLRRGRNEQNSSEFSSGLVAFSFAKATPNKALDGRFSEAIQAEKAKAESSGLRRGRNEQNSSEFSSGLVAFSFAKATPNKALEKRSRSMSPSRFRIKRSGSVASRSANPVVPVMHSGSVIYRSISSNIPQMSNPMYPERERRKDIEVYSKKTKNLFKALLSIH
nr:26S proteasome non-ATPase regulatory subunit 8 homolog A-like [Tanacetum cinerariifolium]